MVKGEQAEHLRDGKASHKDGELLRNYLELCGRVSNLESMVDATTCRMNPLAALNMDRSNLMRDSLRAHSGLVYPGLKAREAAPLPLSYMPDLHYKHDITLQNRKLPNGYIGLYKSPPPGLQKPLLLTGVDALGLESHVGPPNKQTELGLNSSSSYLQLPWMSHYPDPGMYPFIDSTKYAQGLSMYKGSFLSQPSPCLPQHLTFQPLCAGGAAGVDRLYYMPPYMQASISSLAPPIRIPTATIPTTSLSPLFRCQDKSVPRTHHDSSAYGHQLHSQLLHQQHLPHPQSYDNRLHSSSKSSRNPSCKSSSGMNSKSSPGNSLAVALSSAHMMQPHHVPVLHPSIAPPAMESTQNFLKPVPRGPPSSPSPSMSPSVHFSSKASEIPSAPRSASHKARSKDGSSDHKGSERKSSKTPPKISDKLNQKAVTKDPVEKPLDLSSKMDFVTFPNGFNLKLEALDKHGNCQSTSYGLHSGQELHKEFFLSPSTVSTSSKFAEKSEIISTLHSSWVVPSAGLVSATGPMPALFMDSVPNKTPSVIQNTNLESLTPQQRSSSCPRIGESNPSPPVIPASTIVTAMNRPTSVSPSPTLNGEWPMSIPKFTEKASRTKSAINQSPERPSKSPKKTVPNEMYKPSHLPVENGQTSNHLCLPHRENFLPPCLPFGNRYLPYAIPESLTLPHLSLSGKGPGYSHPVLLNSSTSIFPAHMAPKHHHPHGLPPTQGELLTYHDSEMVHPLMSPQLTPEYRTSERHEKRAKSLENSQQNYDAHLKGCHAIFETSPKPEKDSNMSSGQGLKLQTNMELIKERTVCTDFIQDSTEGSSELTKHRASVAEARGPSKLVHNRDSRESKVNDPHLKQLLPSPDYAQQPPTTDLQPELPGSAQVHNSESSHPTNFNVSNSLLHSPGKGTSAENTVISHSHEEQTRHCARTSGNRTSAEMDPKSNTSIHQGHTEPNKESSEELHKEAGERHRSSKPRRSSLTKRIANSSGYVGDRFKCVTNELYEDSSKLSREQRALQMEGLSQEDSNLSQPAAYYERAMLRFSELELKEKEGSSTAAGRVLADSQSTEGAWESSQRGSRPGGTAPSTEAAREALGLVCRNNRVPVVQRCAGQGQGQGLHPREERGPGRARARCGEEVRSPTTERERPPEDAAPCRKRPCSREEAPAKEEGRRGKKPRTEDLTAARLSPDLAKGWQQIPERDGERSPRLRRHGDPDKPKGKRQCKTKHTGSLRERRRPPRTAEDCRDAAQKACLKRSSRKRSASLSDVESSPVKARTLSMCAVTPLSSNWRPPSQPPLPPIGTPTAEAPPGRPMPPEVRRLIVNKNAGETLLQRAARLGYEEVVLYCLENKVCDVNHRDNAGYCALHEACAHGWLSIVQHLVEHGADINCSAQDGTRPLHDAVENDRLDVVRLLLSYGADPTLATYSGRGLLKMTRGEMMECFLSDYFADLRGREDDDTRLCWELYGSSVCEPTDDPSAFDILANPPGPGDDDDDQSDMFEFEFSDRPFLPCYNIQVSLTQGPRNWLLLSDVLKRLKMSPQAFRSTFTHMEIASIPEDEFYKQASLKQLLSCPEQLEGFLPNSKELLDLVEISAELATLLGSSVEYLGNRWDHVTTATS